jgi:hypothetical protein
LQVLLHPCRCCCVAAVAAAAAPLLLLICLMQPDLSPTPSALSPSVLVFVAVVGCQPLHHSWAKRLTLAATTTTTKAAAAAAAPTGLSSSACWCGLVPAPTSQLGQAAHPCRHQHHHQRSSSSSSSSTHWAVV